MIFWLKQRLSSIIIWILFVILFVIFMFFGGMNWVFTIIVSVVFCIIVLINYYILYKKDCSIIKQQKLQRIATLEDLSKNEYSSLNDIIEIIGDNKEYEIILNIADDLLKKIENNKNNIIDGFISEKKKCNDYLKEWQNVVKENLETIINDINTLDTDNREDFDSHIKAFQKNIAQLIYFYTSLSDDVPEFSTVKMRNITMSVMKRYSKFFIENKINTSFKMVEKSVNTNVEYLNYILDSFIDIAVKYGAKSIKITSNEDENGILKLVMIDNGIGINSGNLDEKSRYSSKRDRINLSVCKSLCEYMGHNLSIISNDVTTAEIAFTQKFNNV